MEFYGECEFIIEPRLLCFVVLFICVTLIAAIMGKTSVILSKYEYKRKQKKNIKEDK